MARALRRYTAQAAADIIASDSEEEEEEKILEDTASDDEVDYIEMNDFDVEASAESDSSDSSESEEDSKIEGRNGFQWSTNPPHRASFRAHNIIRVPLSLMQTVNNCETTEDFFRYMIDMRIVRNIVECTNKRLPENCKEITEVEMYGYIGLLLLMGFTKKNDVLIPEIWKKSSANFMPLAAITMSRERFEEINRHITFDNIDNREQRRSRDRKYFKARELYNHFQTRITSAMEPGEQLCVDETLYSFRGRSSFRQYMPNKPNRYGLKYWTLVDCSTGYVLSTIPYLGKENESSRRAENVGEGVVLEICKPYYRTGRGVTMDNFFCSIRLAQKLWDSGMTLVGTVRKNKGEIPKRFLTAHEKYSSQFAFSGPLTLCSYVPKQKKVVIVLSTQHHGPQTDSGEKKKPLIIASYNSCKGGVDSFDQRVEKYTCRRRTARWPLNAFFYFLDLAAANAVVLFKMKHPSQDHKETRRVQLEILCMQLIRPCILQRMEKWQEKRQGVTDDLKALAVSLGFFNLPEPIQNAERGSSRGRCQLCPRGLDRKARIVCDICKHFTCKSHLQNTCTNCNSQ